MSIVRGLSMFAKFQRDYPVMSILVLSGLMASSYPLSGAVLPRERVLPTLSGMGFLFAASVKTALVLHALHAERRMRSDPPLWSARMAVAQGVGGFVALVVLTGEPLRSVEAAICLGAALACGALMAPWAHRSEMGAESGLFDLERPMWRTPLGRVWTKWSALAVLGVAGLAVAIAPRTEFGLFAVIVAIPLMLPFGSEKVIRWREREWMRGLSFTGLMFGLFTAG